MTQQELPFKGKGKKPKSNPLLSMLESYERWIKAKILERVYGWTERECRDMAEQSDGHVISGQRGYKASLYATPDEINHSSAWLISQGTKMVTRGIAQKRVAHENLKRKK